MLKRIISLSLIIVMMVSLARCKLPKATSIDTQTNTNNTESVTSKQAEKERVIDEAKAYLRENYPDDEFTYVSGRSPEWAYNYYELAFTSKKYDNQEVIVYGDPRKDDNPNSVVMSYYRDDNGNVIYDYFDTYYQYSMKSEAEEYFYDQASKYIENYCSVKIEFYDGIGFAKSVVSKSSFVENAKNDTITYYVCFDFNNNVIDIDFQIMKFLEDLAKDGINTDVIFSNVKREHNGDCNTYVYTIENGLIEEAWHVKCNKWAINFFG